MADAAQYQLGEELGRGALGRVVAVDDGSGRALAGKLLHGAHRADPRARARFVGEATLAKRLDHPNIVPVHGLVDSPAGELLLMDRVDGPALDTVLATEGPLPLERILTIARGIAAGLDAAHHAGIIHRDLKPGNVLIAAGDRPRLVDFGLARATSFAGIDPGAFAVVGTPDYMAPESVDPLAVDGRSDLYSLGCILHEMCTGAPPFTAATPLAILEAHRRAAVPTIEVTADRPAAFTELVRDLLAKSPADRPQSAAVVQRQLEVIASADEAALLAPTGRAVTLAAGRCARCGEPALEEVAVCFGCGQARARLEAGDRVVLVVGPGQETHKLDAETRQRLLDWLTDNPTLGIDPRWLRKHTPRLPFVVASGIAATAAEALVADLTSLGLTCEVVSGSRLGSERLRRKAWTMSGRHTVIALTGVVGLHVALGWVAVPVMGALAISSLATGWWTSVRPIGKRRAVPTTAPAALAAPLGRVAAVVPTIAERRHRDSLRGVVDRVLALHRALDGGRAGANETESVARLETETDLARLVDLAVVAATGLDRIDAQLAAADLRNPDEPTRELLAQRDAWAARLLESQGLLDALRLRFAAAHLRRGNTGDDVLGELRAQIEALEEVQAL